MENTCLERVCYTDTIIKYLKQSEWDKIVNDTPSPVGIFQQYLNHYHLNYDECYNGFWNKDYECMAQKAASIKVINDVYYNKEYLLSWRAKRDNEQSNTQKGSKEEETKANDKHEKGKHYHRRGYNHRFPRYTEFGFDDIGDFAFNIWSGLR